MRQVTVAEYCHERLGDEFERALSSYDTLRRVETLVDEFLPDSALVGSHALDVGCGLGYFSERLQERGAHVTGCDIGVNLLERTRARVGCHTVLADALRLLEQFAPNQFDVVVSSECIEHTPDPAEAVRQMVLVLKPGGLLAISTPNLLWFPVVRMATWLGVRPFDGHENFSTWHALRRSVGRSGAQVIREKGLHLFPFQFGAHGVSRWLDRRAQPLRAAMINLCVLARKRGPTPAI
ncbi:MAG: class I SAM-dependent methyltransferase [Planctomycetota bacterium]|nr:class I SAM-dependent methyltransferase [Planctomycetota bacterium]